MKAYIILLIGILLGVVGQYFFKGGVNNTSFEFNNISSIIKLFLSPMILIGLTAYALSTLFYLVSLKTIPQSVAYPAISVGYILVVLIAWRFYGESLTVLKIMGVLTIMLGVGLLFIQNSK